MRDDVKIKEALNKLKKTVLDLARTIAWQGTWLGSEDRWLVPLGRYDGYQSQAALQENALQLKLDALIRNLTSVSSYESLVPHFVLGADDWKNADHYIGKHQVDATLGNGDGNYIDAAGYIENLFLQALRGKLAATCQSVFEAANNDIWVERVCKPEMVRAILAAEKARHAMGVVLPIEPTFCEKVGACFGSFFHRKKAASQVTAEIIHQTSVMPVPTRSGDESTPLLMRT